MSHSLLDQLFILLPLKKEQAWGEEKTGKTAI
jgi:hypothetical protein